MAYDKKLHLLCGFAIAIVAGSYTPATGLICSVAAGVAKEVYDEYDYGGFDKQDMLATWAGSFLGVSIAHLLCVIAY